RVASHLQRSSQPAPIGLIRKPIKQKGSVVQSLTRQASFPQDRPLRTYFEIARFRPRNAVCVQEHRPFLPRWKSSSSLTGSAQLGTTVESAGCREYPQSNISARSSETFPRHKESRHGTLHPGHQESERP